MSERETVFMDGGNRSWRKIMDATAGRLFGTIGLPGEGALHAVLRDSGAACASWRFSLSALERKKAIKSRR